MEMRRDLARSLPAEKFTFVGEHYPTPFSRILLSNVLLFVALISGTASMLCGLLSFLPVSIHQFVVQNRSSFLMCALGCFMASNAVLKSGALEVYVNDKLVFSKLKENRPPSFEELIELILEASLFNHK